MNLTPAKRMLSIILSLLLIMSILPISSIQAFASEVPQAIEPFTSSPDEVPEDEHECTYENGFCTTCDGYEKPEIIYLSSTYKYFGFKNTSVALIRNAGNLYYYATHLTSEYYPNALLMNDIVVNKKVLNSSGELSSNHSTFRKWVPFSFSFTVFDGNGYEISGLYISESESGSTGFVYSNNSTIRNLGIVDSYFENNKNGYSYTGGIAASNYGHIEKCYFEGTIRSSGYYAGGLVGNHCGTITDCYNAAKIVGSCESAGINAKLGYSTDSNHQFLNTKLTNSFNYGNINGIISNTQAYSKHAVTSIKTANENLIIGNLYYIDSCGADDDYAEAKTREQFRNGEVTELLNDGRTENNTVWYQNEVKGHPDLLKKHLTYDNLLNGIPLNPTEYCDKNGHKYKNGFCTNPRYDDSPCNAYEPAHDSDGNEYYEITNGGQLYWFAEQVNEHDNYSIKGELLNDIYVNLNVLNLNGTLNTSTQHIPWTPIGDTLFTAYDGDFNGNDFKIYGLYAPDTTSDMFIGLFGVSYGNIKNVTLINSYFGGSNRVEDIGSICGIVINGTIMNCKNENTIVKINDAEQQYIGGICGYASGSTITGSINKTDINTNGTKSSLGGICGEVENCMIDTCINEAKVSATGTEMSVGGIIGKGENATATECYNKGNVLGESNSNIGGLFGLYGTKRAESETSLCYNTGTITGNDNSNVGGLFGKINSFGTHIVKECYNTGKVSVESNGTAGGICGITDTVTEAKGNAVITECYNTAEIKANANSYAGGICAKSDNNCEISKCYNSGKISSPIYSGGIAGHNGGSISISYNKGVIASDSSTAYIGGICGSNTESGKIDNAYNVGSFTGKYSALGGICGDNKGSVKNSHNYKAMQTNGKTFPICCTCSAENVENCYYLVTSETPEEIDDCEGTTATTAEHFASGEIAYFLNNKTSEGEPAWKQTLKTDKYPNFDGKPIYTNDSIYSNAPIIVLYGDIKVRLNQVPDKPTSFIGYADLEEGVYNFKVKKNTTELGGRNYCFDTTYSTEREQHLSLRYFSQYTAQSELKATGGRYTFSYNSEGDYMFINYISSSDVVELLDASTYDNLVTLQKTTGTYYTALLRVDKPTIYNFRLNDSGTIKGGNYHFIDKNYKDGVINNIFYNPEWSGSTTLEMSGGVYALTYDQATGYLSIQHRVPESETITVFGDFTLNLDQVRGSKHMYSSTIALNKGAYCFRIDKFGDVMCNGDIIKNETTYTPFSITWDRPSILEAEGGMYTFTYNADINFLKIIYTPIDKENISIEFTDESVVLTPLGTGTIYTGTVNLSAGVHKFSVNEFGTIYRSGWTYNNIIEFSPHSTTLYNNSGIIVDAEHAGNYEIHYYVNIKKLSIVPAPIVEEEPTEEPTTEPTEEPTVEPSTEPTTEPTETPTVEPSTEPVTEPIE